MSTHPIKDLRRTADLVFSKARVAVFLDGCFWHGCPDHHTLAATNSAFWAKKVADNRERDGDTDRCLIEANWAVVRVWAHEDPTDAASTIGELVRMRSRSA